MIADGGQAADTPEGLARSVSSANAVQKGAPAPEQALAALGAAAARVAEASTLDEALAAVASAAAAAADSVVVYVADETAGEAEARAVVSASRALVAETEGTRVAVAEIAPEEIEDPDRLPAAVRRVARRAAAVAVLQVPARLGTELAGSVVLLRTTGSFDGSARGLARLAAAQVALAVAAFGRRDGADSDATTASALALAGEALAVTADESRTAEVVAQIAVESTGARACLVWRAAEDEAPVLAAAIGVDPDEPLAGDVAGVTRALHERERVAIEDGAEGVVATVQLGRPPIGALQLVYETAPGPAERMALASFSLRAAEALRAGERAGERGAELERTRALLAVVGQAIAQLSLAHTLETAIEQVSERLRVRRVAVYLREGGRLATAAARRLAGPHAEVGEQLLELALGPFRARGMVVVENAAQDSRLRRVRGALEAASIEAAQAVPLLAHGDVIGLLAVYPRRGRSLNESDSELLAALAAQLAVAVENARLHEQVAREKAEAERAGAAQQAAARRLSALYEISRSFAEQLSLQDTLDALARTVVDLLDGIDAAVIRMPGERGESLVVQALHVADARVRPALEAIFRRPQLVVPTALERDEPFRLDAVATAELGGSHELLVPFLEKGSTAAVLPISTQTELLATLTLLSLDPAQPISDETIETGLSIGRQAALAVDNARLYQQQKQFADTMQRSLLPRRRPAVPGLEVGEAYESSARLDVGGDLYDYLELGDSRLAVVLGDVTGHGIDAAADMAMTKFVFRSLIREHGEPADFMHHANDVVCGEVGSGKFVTMLCLTIDAAAGEIACACAGHPPPRLLPAHGPIRPLLVSGLALGIEPDQRYDSVRAQLEPGTSVVLYTDGLVEARRGEVQFGEERLDDFLAGHRNLPARRLAAELLAECRRFAEGELTDDCAAIVIRRVPRERG
jgi:serine phosphatase RsbU (regulator of sigma subunit)